VFALGLTAGPAAALTQDDLDGMVQALHVRNQRVDPKIWALDYSGKQLPSFTLNIGLSEDGGTVILLVKLAKKGEFTSDLDFFRQLNDLNDYYDDARVVVDESGSLFVRMEMAAKFVDQAELKTIVGEEAAASDEIWGKLKARMTGSAI
jgi:hypothetical protein